MSDNKLADVASNHGLSNPPQGNALARGAQANGLVFGPSPNELANMRAVRNALTSTLLADGGRPMALLFGKRYGSYEFVVHQFYDPRPPGGGVYVFARPRHRPTLLEAEWVIEYAGECNDFVNRIGTSHEHWAEAMESGVSHVLYMLLLYSTKQQRLDIETDLRHFYDPPLNRQ